MRKFLMLVSFDQADRTKVISCYSPDFDALLIPENVGVNFVTALNAQQIERFIQQQCRLHPEVMLPKSLAQLNNYPIYSELQHWQEFEYIDHIQPGFFERCLPVTGHVANGTAILSGSMVTYMAIKLLIYHPGSDGLKSDAVSVSGAALDSFLSMVIFTFSGTTVMLANVGAVVDQMCKHQNNPQPAQSNKLLSFIYAITLGLILTDTCIRGVNTYQQIIPLIDTYLDLYPELTPEERERDTTHIRWFALYTLLAAWTFTNISFQANFANMLIKHFVPAPGKPILRQFTNQMVANNFNSEIVDLEDGNRSLLATPTSESTRERDAPSF
jgi:hypothetical protein